MQDLAAIRKGVRMKRLPGWTRGIRINDEQTSSMFTYLWFYEWNLFETVAKGQHTPGRRDFEWQVDDEEARMASDVFGIHAQASDDHANLELKITNRTSHRWPEIAPIIPSFNPGDDKETKRNDTFMGPQPNLVCQSRWISRC
jgi:hypothetical protein